tara:strand:+ start:2471 stop:2725 length:255 start_codon:yes stop_codon:yes gene_type:complete
LENTDLKKAAKSYSENNIFGSRLRTYYDENNEIVYCENASIKRDDLLKSLKRLSNSDLSRAKKPVKKQNKKPGKRRFPKNRPNG